MSYVEQQYEIEPASGVRIQKDLAGNMAPVERIRPNNWNPNRMETSMRERLVRAIRKDGFIVPIIVRPVAGDPEHDWEIIDGEHRWDVARGELGMQRVPVLDVGPISDEHAKEITVKANALRGEFDSIKLGELVQDLVNSGSSIHEIAQNLPYQPERLQTMIDIIKPPETSPVFPQMEDKKPDEDEEKDAAPSFQSFDGGAMEFDHKCPRCGFGFNDPKGSSGSE